jgi:hypothetical protein
VRVDRAIHYSITPLRQVESSHLGVMAVMLLNQFLKEHRKVQELEATVVQQKKDMKVFAATLKEQTSQIKK